MLGSLVVSSVLLAAVSGFSITGPGINQCIAGQGDLPLGASVEGCAAPPCAVAQGEDFVVDIVFRAPSDSSTLTTTATAYLMVIPIPYYLGEKSNTCNYLLNSSCPVKEGDILQYSLRLPIEPFLPVGVSTNVEFRILDDKQDAVACIRVPITITAPNFQ